MNSILPKAVSLDMYPNCQTLWLRVATGATQMPRHSSKLSHALLWITCQHWLRRVTVDRILDILSLRIKISSCLPVWDAPCWPNCWVRCKACVPTQIILQRHTQHSLFSSIHFLPIATPPPPFLASPLTFVYSPCFSSLSTNLYC